ncbi:MAG: LysR family transcriptional regulator [Pseudomonadota bacterium]
MIRYTLRQLEYFVAVGETGSIARASERINVSSPSISAAIAQLEKEFGVPLFMRQHAQGLVLTEGGRLMLDQARHVLREAGALMDIAGDISGSVRGPLRVGCLVSFVQLVLPKLRRAFETAYPEVRFRQFEMNQANLLSALRRSEIDVALTYDMELPADLVFTPLSELSPIALLGAQHPLAGRETVSIEALKDHPMVLLDLPISADYFLSLFDERPVIAERTSDMAVMRSMVGNGFGYSIVNMRPPSDIAPDGTRVLSVPIAGPVRSLRMGLLTSRQGERSNAVRAFSRCASEMVPGRLATGAGGAPPA